MVEQNLVETARGWVASTTSVELGQRGLKAIAIFAGAFVLARLLKLGLDRLRRRSKLGGSIIYIVEQIGGYLILLVGLLAAVATLGVDLTSLTIFGGALGVGVGLGLQGVVKEFVSGLVLIFDPDIRVGDYVEIEDGVRGEVVEIGARATRLRTNDDLNVVIPNSALIQNRVTNWTYNEGSRRIHVPFSVAEGSDVALVREVVLEAACALPFTRPDDHFRKTQVWLTGFRGAGLDFDLVVWPRLESSRHPRTMHAAYTWAIYEALLKAGVDNACERIEVSLQSLAGDEGEAVLRALQSGKRSTRRRPARTASAPNDAAQAMFDDASRDRQSRVLASRKGNRMARDQGEIGRDVIAGSTMSQERASPGATRVRPGVSGSPVADRVGFEPTVGSHLRRFSRPLP